MVDKGWLGCKSEAGASLCVLGVREQLDGPLSDAPAEGPRASPWCTRGRRGGVCLSLARDLSYLLPRLKRNESSSSVQNYFHLDSLQKKLKDLEEENVVLRSEVTCAPRSCPVHLICPSRRFSVRTTGTLAQSGAGTGPLVNYAACGGARGPTHPPSQVEGVFPWCSPALQA